MDATPGEGEQAKGGERQDVARTLPDHGREISAYPLSREISRWCCPCIDCERNIYASKCIIITFCSDIKHKFYYFL
jgi:hypothetical protein